MLLHHNEGNAVGQSPVFVGARLVKVEDLCKEGGIDADDSDVIGALALLNKLNGTVAIEATEGVTDFDQNGFGEPHF